LRAIEERYQLVEDRWPVRLRRDLGGDRPLGLDAELTRRAASSLALELAWLMLTVIADTTGALYADGQLSAFG
jgi:hypothetical protein